MLLTTLSWVHAWLVGCPSRQRRIAGWLLGAGALAPASALYAYLTGQLPYILANAVFAVLAVRGLRAAVTGRNQPRRPGRLVARLGQPRPAGRSGVTTWPATGWQRAQGAPVVRTGGRRRVVRRAPVAARR